MAAFQLKRTRRLLAIRTYKMANPSQAYMTVPEKIELANSGPTGYPTSAQSAGDHRYKPMKVRAR